MSVAHSDNKLKINKYTTNFQQLQDHEINKKYNKENYFKLIKIPTKFKTQICNANQSQSLDQVSKSICLKTQNNNLSLPDYPQRQENQYESLPEPSSNKNYKKFDDGKIVCINSNLKVNLSQLDSNYDKSNTIKSLNNNNYLNKHKNNYISKKKFRIIPMIKTESGKNNDNSITNNVNHDIQNIKDAKNNCEQNFNNLGNQITQQLIEKNNIISISSSDFFQDVQRSPLRKINPPKEQNLIIPKFNSQYNFSQMYNNNWNINNTMKLKKNENDSFFIDGNIKSASLYTTADVNNNEFYQCNSPYFPKNVTNILETNYFPKFISQNFSQRNEVDYKNIYQINSEKIINNYNKFKSINLNNDNNPEKKNDMKQENNFEKN